MQHPKSMRTTKESLRETALRETTLFFDDIENSAKTTRQFVEQGQNLKDTLHTSVEGLCPLLNSWLQSGTEIDVDYECLTQIAHGVRHVVYSCGFQLSHKGCPVSLSVTSPRQRALTQLFRLGKGRELVLSQKLVPSLSVTFPVQETLVLMTRPPQMPRHRSGEVGEFLSTGREIRTAARGLLASGRLVGKVHSWLDSIAGEVFSPKDASEIVSIVKSVVASSGRVLAYEGDLVAMSAAPTNKKKSKNSTFHLRQSGEPIDHYRSVEAPSLSTKLP